jgi:chorismate mutase
MAKKKKKTLVKQLRGDLQDLRSIEKDLKKVRVNLRKFLGHAKLMSGDIYLSPRNEKILKSLRRRSKK